MVRTPNSLIILINAHQNIRVSHRVVDPALTSRGADAVHPREVGPLAQPASHKDAPEAVVGGVAGAEDLAEGARVELVDHLSVGVDHGLARVVLEVRVVD